jgi:hypothetical protein
MHPMLNIAVRAARCTGNVIIFVRIMLAGITYLVSNCRAVKTHLFTLSGKLQSQTQRLFLLRCVNACVHTLKASRQDAGHSDSQCARAGLTYTRTPANRFSFTTAVLSLFVTDPANKPCPAYSKALQGVYGHFG